MVFTLNRVAPLSTDRPTKPAPPSRKASWAHDALARDGGDGVGGRGATSDMRQETARRKVRRFDATAKEGFLADAFVLALREYELTCRATKRAIQIVEAAFRGRITGSTQ